MELERLSQQQFARFRDFIYEISGIRIDDKKVTLLSNRVRRRLKAGDFQDFDAYYRFLKSPSGRAELPHFLDAITTNETFFFRTRKHFEWLASEALPEWNSQHRKGQRPAALRIWSAGCASGAEPYSIAICLAENAYRLRDWSLRVLGTDISQEALQAARAGVFSARAVEAVSAPQRRRFLQPCPESTSWEVKSEIRGMVEFQQHNLMRPLREDAFDCIFIRNVLIYFDRTSKAQVIDHLRRALAPGGYLVTGPSEGIYDMVAPLQRVSPFLYRKPDASSAGPSSLVERNPQR